MNHGSFCTEAKELPKGYRILTGKKQKLLPLRPSYLTPTFEHSEERRIPNWLRERVQARDNFSCRYCDHYVLGGAEMHTHHLNSTETILDNLVTCCPACHTVNHIWRGLRYGSIEIWKSPVAQVEIVRMSREAFRLGRSLDTVKAQLKVKEHLLAPNDLDWTRIIPATKASGFSTSLDQLDKNLRVVFVKFVKWQVTPIKT